MRLRGTLGRMLAPMLEQLQAENKRLQLAVAMMRVQNHASVVEAASKNVRRLKSEYEESLRVLGNAQVTSNRLAAELADLQNP